jgi:hypothetical protein
MRIRILKESVRQEGTDLIFDIQLLDYPEIGARGCVIPIPANDTEFNNALKTEVAALQTEITNNDAVKTQFATLIDKELNIT